MVTFGVTCTKFSDANGVARPKIQDGQQDLFLGVPKLKVGNFLGLLLPQKAEPYAEHGAAAGGMPVAHAMCPVAGASV